MDQASSSDNPDSSNNNSDKNNGQIMTSFNNLAPNEVASSWHVFCIFSWIIFTSTLFLILFGVGMTFNQETQLIIKQPLSIIYLLILNISGLAITIKKTIYEKDQGFMNTFFGVQIKQQSIGFLSGAGCMLTFRVALDYLLELMRGTYLKDKETYIYTILGLITGFSILGFLCLLYSYSKINQLAEWYEIIIIKKGVLSSVIGYLFYFMCVSSLAIGLSNSKESDEKAQERWLLSFLIIIPIINIIFAFSQKDLGIAITNLIIYISFSSSFFYHGGQYDYDDDYYSSKYKDPYRAEEIISLCVVVITFILILYLIFSTRDKIIKA